MLVKNRISTNDFSTTRSNFTKSSHIQPLHRLRSKKKHTIIIQHIRRGKGGVPKICQTAKCAELFLARTAKPDTQIGPFLCQSTQAGPKGRAVSRTTLKFHVGGELHHLQSCASLLRHLGLNLDPKNGWQLTCMTRKRWWTS